MRKIVRNILIAATALAAVVSCEDNRENNMVDDSLGFNNAKNDNLTEIPVYVGSYDLAVIKSGKGKSAAQVLVSGSNKGLLDYNEMFGTELFPVEKELYSLSSEMIDFKAEEVSKTVSVSWDVAAVSAYMAQEPDNSYVIPLELFSEDLDVNAGRHLVLLQLVQSTLSTEQDLFSRTVVFDAEQAVKETNYISVNMDKAIPGIDVEIEFVIDNELVEEYNAANGTEYAAAPEGLVTLGAKPVIKGGETVVQFPVEYNTEVLFKEGAITPFEGYVAPIRIKGTSVDGIVLGNVLTYFVVKGMAPVPPQLFDRLWGLYSTSSTSPWYGNLMTPPPTGGPDRNIAMDDDYVYASQSNGTEAKILVYDIKTGNHVKDIVFTASSNDEGAQAHQVSCVRVIKNTSADVNGGKDILVVSSLGIGIDNYVYAFVDGIDAAPRVTRMESWRRLGDKFTVSGTWQSGRMYFGDNDGTRKAVVYFNIKDGKFGEDWGTVEHAQPAKFDLPVAAGLGDYTVHPQDNTYALLTSTENSAMLTGNSTLSPWGTDPQLAMTFGYNFFSKNGKNYIAYFKLDPETHAKGSVVVLNDPTGLAADFQSTLEAQDIAYTAPIQDAMDASVVSPIVASPYIGDCTVREINGEIYMAVLQNGGGLSVFKMN